MKKNENSLVRESAGQSYANQYEELQKILTALEQGDLDVDELSEKVKRAGELIESCQKRLHDTEVQVKKVMDKFEKSLAQTEE